MKKIMILSAGILAFGLLSGCVVVVDGDKNVSKKRTSFEQQEDDNRASISQLNIGSSPGSVLNKMGTPDFDENLNKEGNQYRILYYRTQRVKADGITTKDECTPLVFANGELLGWGEAHLDMIN